MSNHDLDHSSGHGNYIVEETTTRQEFRFLLSLVV